MRTMRPVATVTALLLASAYAFAQAKPCEELKAEIAQKLEAKNVKSYSLEIMAKDDKEGDAKVVGTCEGGTKKIVYERKAAAPALAPAPTPAPSKP